MQKDRIKLRGYVEDMMKEIEKNEDMEIERMKKSI